MHCDPSARQALIKAATGLVAVNNAHDHEGLLEGAELALKKVRDAIALITQDWEKQVIDEVWERLGGLLHGVGIQTITRCDYRAHFIVGGKISVYLENKPHFYASVGVEHFSEFSYWEVYPDARGQASRFEGTNTRDVLDCIIASWIHLNPEEG